MSGRTPGRRALLTVFALTLGTYAYFYQGGGPNQFSRFGLTAALAEQGQVAIDSYHHLTFDKAAYEGHYYCDKAPGLSLLAVPGYLLCRPLIGWWTQPGSRAWVNLSLYVMTLLAVSLPVALAMASFYGRAYREAGPAAAFWVTIALGLGSPLAVYASLYYSHALCAALLWLAFDVLTGGVRGGPISAGRASVAGLLVGWATLSEFPAALAGGLLLLFLCLAKPRSWRAVKWYLYGGLPALGLLLLYNKAAFDSPLVSGYQYHTVGEFREQMSRGIMGVTGPSLTVLGHMLLTPFRGLLWFWPFFACVLPAGLLLLLERDRRDGSVHLAGCIVGVYLLFGCSYYAWWGGASFGPRHIVPCLPFAAYLVVRAYQSVLRWLVPPLTVLSVIVALASVATLAEFPDPVPAQPQNAAGVVGVSGLPLGSWNASAALVAAPPQLSESENQDRLHPLLRIALPRLLRGATSVKVIGQEGLIEWTETSLPPTDPRFYDACNLGELLGLRGLASLIPLAAFWLILGVPLVSSLVSRDDRWIVSRTDQSALR